MHRSKLIATICGCVIALALCASSFAAGAGGGGGVGGVGGIGGFGGAHGGGMMGIPGGAPGTGNVAPPTIMNPYLYDRHFRELKLAGQVPAVPDKLPSGARIVQLRMDGKIIPMALDTELGSSELEFEPGERYAEELYTAVLTKSVAVVGDSALRERIIQAAGSSQPIEVEGKVFNSTTPYFVVTSVEAAK
ncbi:MAG TPA: hypothetical protein VMA09_05555 [Candidatus Binataceae bacterium]|nr:hypothetical protein [Candidatus Binataceae bacterium]